LIKFLQDAAGKGDLDPWDIDVISVIDSFLEQYSQSFGSKSNSKSSYQKDLSETSEAFFAASVLVNLKAQVLESDVFKENSSDFEDDFDLDDQDWIDEEFDIPKFPEKYLRRRSIAQPILKRATTLGELVSQLESIAEVIETQDLLLMKRKRNKKYSDKFLNEKFVGTGKYVLNSFSNEVQSIDPNLNYWGEKPLNKGIDFVGYSNSSSLFGALKSKQIDVLLSNSIDDSQRKSLNNLSKNKQFNEGNSPFTELSFISLKTSSYPLSNLN